MSPNGAHVPELHLETREPPVETIVQREFSPSYAGPDRRVILLSDFVKAKPGLAISLLRGLALLRDVEQVPSEVMLGFTEVGQAALKVYNKVTKVAAEQERYKNDRDTTSQKAKASDQQARTLRAEVQKLKKELVDMKIAADAT
ncbi:hypothetical protein RHSIM_Rhsim11G0037400 [Rhododendron simsii]|uniref:Uncharacterized protein n=1 Tax=Rhododendron simsii TaxID=118357 RepID=A0A834G939_RHOSS|nr:hypothetical protein RHSIM_Rhsim11G0037400 [Rhododendron simsii]